LRGNLSLWKLRRDADHGDASVAGKGYSAAIGSGVRTAVTVAVLALTLFSIVEMLRRSVRLRYDGPGEALAGMLELMWDYGSLMMVPSVLGVLAAGAVIGGIASEWAKSHWP
jgi:hypothetical protein